MKQEPRMRRPKLGIKFPKSKKGHNSVKLPFRVMLLGQVIALVMLNKFVKFHSDSLYSKKVIAKVKVFNAAAVHDTRVMTIPSFFSPKKDELLKANWMKWKEPRKSRPMLGSWLSKSKKGHNSVKMHFRVPALSQNTAPVMVNKCAKFHKDNFNRKQGSGLPQNTPTIAVGLEEMDQTNSSNQPTKEINFISLAGVDLWLSSFKHEISLP